MNVFLTGGTGFIGSHVMAAAIGAGHRVIALRRPGSRPPFALAVEPEWIDGDLEQVPAAAFDGCEAFLHLAAHGVDPAMAAWDACFRWNVTAPLALWQAAERAGCRRFVICGSCFEYGRSGERYDFIPVTAPLEPSGPYHASKAAATMAAIGFAIDRRVTLSVLRPFHVFGEGEADFRFWPSLRRAALAGEDFPMSSGEQVRDFIGVAEVARAIVAELSRGDLEPGQPRIANLGSGRPMRLADFAREQWASFGATGSLRPGEVPVRANEVMRYVPDLS